MQIFDQPIMWHEDMVKRFSYCSKPTVVCTRPSLDAHDKYWRGRDIAKATTENARYNSHKFTRARQLKIGKILPCLTNLDFCNDAQIVGSPFLWWCTAGWVRIWCKELKSILPCVNSSGWCNAREWFLGQHSVAKCWLSHFKCHSILEYCCWP